MIFFFRHGETYWNKEKRYQGALNSPLTENGINQIELVCKIFEKDTDLRTPLKVYVSPLGRARQTANILKSHFDIELIEDVRLKEVSLGSWDGKTREELLNTDPSKLVGAQPYNWYFYSPDGETILSAKKRVASWLQEVQDKNVGAVAHGLIGRIIMGVYLGLSDDEMLKLAIAQDSYYKIHDGKVYPIGKGVLNSDEA